MCNLKHWDRAVSRKRTSPDGTHIRVPPLATCRAGTSGCVASSLPSLGSHWSMLACYAQVHSPWTLHWLCSGYSHNAWSLMLYIYQVHWRACRATRATEFRTDVLEICWSLLNRFKSERSTNLSRFSRRYFAVQSFHALPVLCRKNPHAVPDIFCPFSLPWSLWTNLCPAHPLTPPSAKMKMWHASAGLAADEWLKNRHLSCRVWPSVAITPGMLNFPRWIGRN